MSSLPFAVRRPKVVLLVWFLVIAVAGFTISVFPKIHIDPSVKSLIRQDDVDLEFDANSKKVLADDEMITIAVASPDTVFDIPTLTYIERLTSEIEKLPWVRKVYSLTRADNIRGQGGMLLTDDLIKEFPKTKADLERIEKDATENPIYLNTILAPDHKVAGINIELKAGHQTQDDADTVEGIYKILDDAESLRPAEDTTHLSGFPVASYLSARMMMQDMLAFSGGSLVLLMLIMFLVLRSWHGVAFTMMVAFATVNVTYALISICGFSVTTPLSTIMPFLTAIAMEYTVYVVFAYRHAAQHGPEGREKRATIAASIRDVRFTVIISAACTAAAFGSICTNSLRDLVLLGAFLAIGTITCCLATLTIVPAWLTLFPFPVPTAGTASHSWLQGLVDRINSLVSRRPRTVVAGLAVVAATGVLLLTQLHTDLDAFKYFRPSSKIRQDHDFITERMAGDALIPVVIVADKMDAFKDPQNLQKLDDIAKYASQLPHVTKALTHADHIKLMNRALMGGPDDYKLPPTKEAVEQFLLLHNEPDDFHPWIDPDYKQACIVLRMNSWSSTLLQETEAKVEAYAATKLPPNYDVRAIGTTLLAARSVDEMARSLVTGALAAAFAIWVILCLGFRSIKIGTIALIPTLPPAIMVYATLPVIGHPLEVSTSITGTIALGIAIDDTTWFIATWISKRRTGVDANTAVRQTLSAIGRPMVLSSMVLGSGFLIMLFSRYLTLFWLGVMMAVVSFWSIFWDMLCTPAVIRLLDPKLPKGQFGHEDIPPPTEPAER